MESHLDKVSDLDRHIRKLASFLEHSDQCLQDKLDIFFAETLTSFNLEVMLFEMARELELFVHFKLTLKSRIGFLLLLEYLLGEAEFFTELIEFTLQVLPFLVEDTHLLSRLTLHHSVIVVFTHLTN
mgnify:CR=1 FL=1